MADTNRKPSGDEIAYAHLTSYTPGSPEHDAAASLIDDLRAAGIFTGAAQQRIRDEASDRLAAELAATITRHPAGRKVGAS